jgi:hypothetical protein
MAEEMQIRGTQDEVKIRSPWAAALLPIVTLGVYQVVWWYKINRELRDYGYAKEHDLGQNPTNSALALFPGFLLLGIPPLVSYWRGFQRVQGASTLAGQEAPNGWIALLLFLLIGPAFNAYVQVTLNDVWRQDADETVGALPPSTEEAPAQRPAGQEPGTPEAPPQEPPQQQPPG